MVAEESPQAPGPLGTYVQFSFCCQLCVPPRVDLGECISAPQLPIQTSYSPTAALAVPSAKDEHSSGTILEGGHTVSETGLRGTWAGKVGVSGP